MASEASTEIEAFLADWLGKDSALTALHGGHVHPIVIPEGVDLDARPELVYIAFRRTSTQRPMTLREPTGNAKATFDIAIVGRSDMRGYLAICRAARLVRLKLDGLTTETPQGHYIERAAVVNESDGTEEVLTEDGNALYLVRTLTVEIDHDEESHSAIGGA